jgi:type IV secretion system protein TrbI
MATTDGSGRTRTPGEVRDKRTPPAGVLPRRVQTWIMAGLALVIIVVIMLTGHQAPPTPTTGDRPSAQPAPPPAERIRTFQREMAERGVREPPPNAPPAPPMVAERGASGGTTPQVDPVVDERKRREYQSLFADNVAFSQRSGATNRPSSATTAAGPGSFPTPSPQDLAAFQQALMQATNGRGAIPSVAVAPPDTAASRTSSPAAAPQAVRTPERADGGHRLLEGTVLETVLLNRLDGTFSGPVAAMVTTPVYSEDRQAVLIPAGARVLGEVSPVQNWGDARLAVSFHRLLLPNGETVSLDQFKGLNQVGETGLKDAVNRHYLQVFGASVAIGALSGLAQWGTRGGYNGDIEDASRQSAGASLATSSGRILDRYLNVLPTITIREGHRIKVYLTNDVFLPAYDGARKARKEGV